MASAKGYNPPGCIKPDETIVRLWGASRSDIASLGLGTGTEIYEIDALTMVATKLFAPIRFSEGTAKWTGAAEGTNFAAVIQELAFTLDAVSFSNLEAWEFHDWAHEIGCAAFLWQRADLRFVLMTNDTLIGVDNIFGQTALKLSGDNQDTGANIGDMPSSAYKFARKESYKFKPRLLTAALAATITSGTIIE